MLRLVLKLFYYLSKTKAILCLNGEIETLFFIFDERISKFISVRPYILLDQFHKGQG